MIYPGSIEPRVDFGEAKEDKFFVIAQVEHGSTQVHWRQITGIRPLIDVLVTLKEEDGDFGLSERLRAALPEKEKLADAVVRMTIEYPRAWETMIDDATLRTHSAAALEFRLIKRPQLDARIRIPEGRAVGANDPLRTAPDFLGCQSCR